MPAQSCLNTWAGIFDCWRSPWDKETFISTLGKPQSPQKVTLALALVHTGLCKEVKTRMGAGYGTHQHKWSHSLLTSITISFSLLLFLFLTLVLVLWLTSVPCKDFSPVHRHFRHPCVVWGWITMSPPESQWGAHHQTSGLLTTLHRTEHQCAPPFGCPL